MHDSKWENNICTAIRRGDKNAFRQLYEKYYAGLVIIASRYTGQQSVAEETVQDTFLKLWENHRQIEIRENLSSYLYASVRNGCLNYLKHLLIERKYSAGRAQQLHKVSHFIHISQEDGSSILIAEEMEKSLRQALAELPPKCREIFILHRQEGMKYSEIAKKLGISQNTVQKQISIALEKLRAKLLQHIR